MAAPARTVLTGAVLIHQPMLTVGAQDLGRRAIIEERKLAGHDELQARSLVLDDGQTRLRFNTGETFLLTDTIHTK